MTAVVPSTVPAELIAGDTWAFTREYGDYPPGTWTATIYFEFTGDSLSQVGTTSSNAFLFTITAATTATKKAGRYKWWIRVTDGSSSYTIDSGWSDVLPNPSATGTRDHRSWARRTLDAVEATLENKATADQSAMTINGRSLSRIPLVELRDWKKDLENRVRNEEGGTAGKGRDIKARYGSV